MILPQLPLEDHYDTCNGCNNGRRFDGREFFTEKFPGDKRHKEGVGRSERLDNTDLAVVHG